MAELNPSEADRLEATVLVDSYTDLLLRQSTDVVVRPILFPPKVPLAEHGLSCLLKVRAHSLEHVVLLDAGVSPLCLGHNADLLKVDLSRTESVVLAHGHDEEDTPRLCRAHALHRLESHQ